jgi:hypothetical protein
MTRAFQYRIVRAVMLVITAIIATNSETAYGGYLWGLVASLCWDVIKLIEEVRK